MALAQAGMPDSQIESNVLKALAGAPDLANEGITTRTVYGTVTLSGSVRDEPMRREAETLASRADGVKKVVDELQLGTPAAQTDQLSATQGAAMEATTGQPPQPVLQSDGTYAPATVGSPAPGTASANIAQRNDPDADQALDRQVEAEQTQGQSGQGQQTSPMPQGVPNPGSASAAPNAPGGDATGQSQAGPYAGRRPMYGGYPPYGYPPNASRYPQEGAGYPPRYNQGYPPYSQNSGYAQNPGPGTTAGYSQAWQYGQPGGQTVVVPAGTMVRIRINRALSSDHAQPGQPFDGIVVNDVVAGGQVAIPRGSAVQGKVVDVQSSGVLKGRGELSIQLTDVTLGGKSYPIVSNVWNRHGGDKTTETIDKTAGIGALGAVFGAVAGGGVGAAVGGGIGAAVGLGSSAASGRGQVFIPFEGVVSFELAQQAEVTTVSQQEMQRLAYGVPPGADQRYYRPGPRVYLTPGYYPGYYPGYGPGYYPYGYPRY